jgi:hypothetical protein
MNMNLPELIENLWLDRDLVDPVVVNQAITTNYNDRDLVRLCEVFLRGIGKVHSVSGKIVETLWGISDYYQEHHELTPKQRVYVIQNILQNWHQVGLEMRCQLGI